MNSKAKHDIRRKLKILNLAKENGNIRKTCRYYGISKTIFYQWKQNYERDGENGLINKKPCPENLKLRTPKPIENKGVNVLRKYPDGSWKAVWDIWNSMLA